MESFGNFTMDDVISIVAKSGGDSTVAKGIIRRKDDAQRIQNLKPAIKASINSPMHARSIHVAIPMDYYLNRLRCIVKERATTKHPNGGKYRGTFLVAEQMQISETNIRNWTSGFCKPMGANIIRLKTYIDNLDKQMAK